MALELELDSLEGVAEGIKTLYVEKDGKYRLDVAGLDDSIAGKSALVKEREERKKAKAEADELRKTLQDKELAELEGQKKYEDLYKREQENARKSATELDLLKRSIADKERTEAALKVAAGLTRDTAKAELLQKEIMAYAQNTSEGVKFSSDSGDMTVEQLSAFITKKYPFLVDGNQSSGGGAAGSGKVADVNKKFAEYTGAELSEIRKADPNKYEQLRAAHYNK